MAKYGLGRSDLNLRARLAIRGLTDTPERDIAALLRSGQPIEPETSHLLAGAFEGRLKSITIKLEGRNRSRLHRSFRIRLKRLEIGREVKALVEDPLVEERLSYDDGVKKVAAGGTSEATVEAAYTFLNKRDAWVTSSREAGSQHTDFELTVAFIYSDLKGIRPEEAIKPSLSTLAALLEEVERDLIDSRELRLPTTAPDQ